MRTLALVLLTLVGCDPIEPVTDVAALTAPRAEAPAAQAAVPAPIADAEPVDADVDADTAGGFDFDADSPEAVADADAPVDDAAMLEGLGLEPTEPAAEELPEYPEDVPTEEPMPAMGQPGMNPGTPVSNGWTPDQAVALTGAVRLISTTAQSQPPRAILGLADGTEVVVEPGTMLPDARLVVLAVGQDAVQVAEITPMGDRARMDSRILQAMYRQNASQR